MSRPDPRHSVQVHKPDGAPTSQATPPVPEPEPDQRDTRGARIWFYVWLSGFAVLALQALLDLVSGFFRF